MERFRGFIKDMEMLTELQIISRVLTEPPSSYLEHNQGKSPVVIIPGLMERWGVMETIADAVSTSGHDVYTVPGLKNNKYNIVRSARIVEKVIEKNGLNEVVVIAHSKGGLIGKQVIIDGLAENMIAVATPFLGSGLARWVPSRPFRELSSRSREIRRLYTNDDVNSRIVSIFSEYDELTQGRCYLDGARENLRMWVKGHFMILEHKGVITYITDTLGIWEQEKQEGRK